MATKKPPQTIVLDHRRADVYPSLDQALSSLSVGGEAVISEYRLVKTTAYRKKAVVEEVQLPPPEPESVEPPMELVPTRVVDNTDDIPF